MDHHPWYDIQSGTLSKLLLNEKPTRRSRGPFVVAGGKGKKQKGYRFLLVTNGRMQGRRKLERSPVRITQVRDLDEIVSVPGIFSTFLEFTFFTTWLDFS